MEPLKNPKGLPCIHTFCLKCLEEYGKDEQPGDEMPCPLCQQMFKIPAGGFKKLPSNIFIEQIAAGTKLFKTNVKKNVMVARNAMLRSTAWNAPNPCVTNVQCLMEI